MSRGALGWPFPAGIDLLVVTEDELGALARRTPGWYEAVTSGRRVA